MRPGYKQTDIGVIPDDWDVSTVGEEFSVQLGKMLDAERNVGVPKPYLGNKAVQWGRIDSTNLPTVPMSRADIDKYRLRDGDLLVCEGGEVGRAAIWDAPTEECYFQKALHRLRPLREFEARLLVAVLRRWSDTSILANYITQTSIAHLPRDKFMHVPIPRPPKPEQRAIAAVLSDVDALLGGLERLIAKKRDLKQAAMQQLLIGRSRLPGFRGEWEARRLGEIAHIKTGKRNNEDKIEDGEYPFFVRSEVVERINSYSHDCEAILVPGEGRIGDIFHYISGRFDVHQRVYAITQFKPSISARFIHHYMAMHFGAWAMQNSVKATVDSLRLPTFQAFEMLLPPTKHEQTAIASVLSDMDAELAVLESRRDKTRALKQAMMQELLTGKTRLVLPGVTETRRDSERTDGRRANIHFKRSVLAAEIIDRLHDEPTFGHVKFEKMIFLAEHLCDVHTGSAYHRDAAGPYDNRAIRSIDSQLRKQKWFDAQKVEGRYRYEPMANRGKHKEYFERYFAGIGASFDTVIDTFRSFTTERCEIVATLFAAWSDLLQQNGPVSDDAIVNEVLHNWHESKKRIPEDRWRKALSWMRDKSFVPHEATGDLS